jgi:hypothetical protein
MKAHTPSAKSKVARARKRLRVEVILHEEASNVIRAKIPAPVRKHLEGRHGDKIVFLEGSQAALDKLDEPFFIVTLQRRRGRKS